MRGAPSSAKGTDGRDALSREEQDILQRLGGAVVAQWNKLPTAVQKALFEHAVSNVDPRECLNLREHIALFLHHHKNDRLAKPSSWPSESVLGSCSVLRPVGVASTRCFVKSFLPSDRNDAASEKVFLVKPKQLDLGDVKPHVQRFLISEMSTNVITAPSMPLPLLRR